jgi:FkbM family methyltransferase
MDENIYKSDFLNDKWIIETIFNKKKKGYFVECGGMDGITNSSTYILEKFYDWDGIVVEADRRFYDSLKKNRKKYELLCLNNSNTITEFVSSNTCGLSGIKKYLYETEEYAKQNGWTKTEWRDSGINEVYKIKSITLETLLDKYNAPKIIDYVAFDMEGAEYHVLKNFNFNKYKILAFSIEGELCDDLLKEKGYIQVENPFNLNGPWEHYFVHKSCLK